VAGRICRRSVANRRTNIGLIEGDVAERSRSSRGEDGEARCLDLKPIQRSLDPSSLGYDLVAHGTVHAT
jgi:hypothetical protein